jgi:long-subunit acyl-CoA synthetase (AMP-forming)
MLEHLLHVDPAKLRTLRRVVTGGGPVMPVLMARLAQQLPNAEIFAVYGSSEAEPIACLPYASISNNDMQAMRAGAGLLAGFPVENASVRILNGEIAVAGAHVVPGYFNGDGDDETKLRMDGRIWHRTGDGGYLDEHGRLWLTGRVRTAIRDALGALEPLRLECALSFEEGVVRSALASSRAERVLFVQPQRGCRIDGESFKARYAWAHIDAVRCLSRLPVDRRHNAKLDYEALRKMIS